MICEYVKVVPINDYCVRYGNNYLKRLSNNDVSKDNTTLVDNYSRSLGFIMIKLEYLYIYMISYLLFRDV